MVISQLTFRAYFLHLQYFRSQNNHILKDLGYHFIQNLKIIKIGEPGND